MKKFLFKVTLAVFLGAFVSGVSFAVDSNDVNDSSDSNQGTGQTTAACAANSGAKVKVLSESSPTSGSAAPKPESGGNSKAGVAK